MTTARTIGVITELEVINSVLSVAGDAPVQSLDDDYQPVFIIRDMINTLSRELQLEGYWFNTESGITLSPNSQTGQTVVPFNTLKFIPVSSQYVLRGTKIYDRTNRTEDIGTDITGDLIVMLEFDALPQSAREYIRAACRVQYNDEYFGETNFKNKLERQLMKAKQELEQEHLENEKINILQAQAITNIAFKNRRR